MFAAVARVTASAVVVMEVAPPTVTVPLCVIAPPVERVRLPVPVLTVPRSRVSVSARLKAPLAVAAETAPVKLFAAVARVTAAAVVVMEVVPPTVNAPLWVIAPVVATPRVPLTVDAPRIRALLSVSLTFLPLVMPTVLKLLADVPKVISFAAPAARVVTPVTVNAPPCVIAPAVATPRVPLTVDAPRIKASASARLTLLPLVMPTAPKLLVEVVRVMLFAAPASRVVTPATVNLPLCVIAPAVITPS